MKLNYLFHLYNEVKFLGQPGRAKDIITLKPDKPGGGSNPPPGFFDSIGKEARRAEAEFDKCVDILIEKLEAFLKYVSSNEPREIFHQHYKKDRKCVICAETRKARRRIGLEKNYTI